MISTQGERPMPLLDHPRAVRAACFAVLMLAMTHAADAQTAAAPLNNHLESASINWAPPDIDAAVPPVDAAAECPLPTVVKQASQRVQEMVSNLLKFAATERMEHFEQARDGKWKSEKPVIFDYLVETREVRKGMLVVEETRGDGHIVPTFPARLATLGLPALALIFHPYFIDEYDMKCEGLGNFDGYYTWQVRFQQRPDKLPRIRSFRIKELIFPLKLKGRAWISADNFQVLHMETDLLEPVPMIQLAREHLSVDYRPVHFRKENEDLWLQKRAEVFMDFRGHRYRRVHTFTDFKLFSVDTEEKISLPADR